MDLKHPKSFAPNLVSARTQGQLVSIFPNRNRDAGCALVGAVLRLSTWSRPQFSAPQPEATTPMPGYASSRPSERSP